MKDFIIKCFNFCKVIIIIYSGCKFVYWNFKFMFFVEIFFICRNNCFCIFYKREIMFFLKEDLVVGILLVLFIVLCSNSYF